ncbi:MAG: hypothetical protein ABIP94_14560 [Planctomycetota bacterium]
MLAGASFESLDELAASLASAPVDLSMHGARRMTVAVHEQWVRSFSIEPPSGLRDLAELRLLATTRMEHLFGADSQAWTLHGAWSPSRPFVVTAVPEALVQAARALCDRIGCRLAEVSACWIRALALQPPPLETQWAGILQPGVLTVALLRERQLVFARSMRVVPDATDAQVRSMTEREQVRRGIDGGTQVSDLHWVDLRRRSAAVPARCPALCRAHDAARRPRPIALPAPYHAWPMLAASASLAVLAWIGTTRLAALTDEHSALVQQVAQAAVAAPNAEPVRPPSRPLSLREVDALNAVARRLNTPWPDIFAALERSTPADIALLGVEPDTRQSRLRGSGQAKDHQSMVSYIERLSSQWPFVHARLVRHELDEKDGARPLKFRFEVSMPEPTVHEAAP